MTGAEALIAAAVRAGIDVCFANPGTTELPLVMALDAVPGIRGILCLHENVATGAADGFARMAGRPAMCLLHLGPGLANGLTNLHNARRAGSPILNVVGEHATWHIAADPLLASDIERIASWTGGHVHRSVSSTAVAADLNAALREVRLDGGCPATLIVPHDVQSGEAVASTQAAGGGPQKSFSSRNVDMAARALRNGRTAILLGGEALSEAGLRLAGRIGARTGATLLCDTFFARMERGGDLPGVTRIPYFPDQALELTRRFDRVVIAGTRRPVAFFGYPGMPSHMTTEEQTVVLAGPMDDAIGALAALADALQAAGDAAPPAGALPPMPSGSLDAVSVSAVLARLQPRDAIIMDEALTVGVPYFEASRHAPRFSHLMLTGGAIGQGPCTATGAAVACPGRKVVNYQSDGCGAYSVQAFWTQARQNLDVVTIIGANRSYNILKVELARAGASAPGPVAQAMAGLDTPHLDWVRIGEGFGVPSVRVDTADGLAHELVAALAQKGPRLIEAVMS